MKIHGTLKTYPEPGKLGNQSRQASLNEWNQTEEISGENNRILRREWTEATTHIDSFIATWIRDNKLPIDLSINKKKCSLMHISPFLRTYLKEFNPFLDKIDSDFVKSAPFIHAHFQSACQPGDS
jgi:hypothetical protein